MCLSLLICTMNGNTMSHQWKGLMLGFGYCMTTAVNKLFPSRHTFVTLSPSTPIGCRCKSLKGNGRLWNRYGWPYYYHDTTKNRRSAQCP